jgi:hypothetical protein
VVCFTVFLIYLLLQNPTGCHTSQLYLSCCIVRKFMSLVSSYRKIPFGIPVITDSCVPVYVMKARGMEV